MKTSFSPLSGAMKPNPFSGLYHLTVPSLSSCAVHRGSGFDEAFGCGRLRGMVPDVDHFDDLASARSFFHDDLEMRPIGQIVAAGSLQHPDVQIGLGAIRQLHEPKALAGVEPQQFCIDSFGLYAWRVLKVARLGSLSEKGILVIAMALSASFAMISVLAHDRFGSHRERTVSSHRIISVGRRVCVKRFAHAIMGKQQILSAKFPGSTLIPP